jgi:magnesium-transporting ATPase (P-type)
MSTRNFQQQQQQQQHQKQLLHPAYRESHMEINNDGFSTLTTGAIPGAKLSRPSTNSKSNFQREAAISKMFACIFMLFLFGYIPYSIIRMFDKSNSLHPDIYVLLTVWFVMTSTISPFIVMQMNMQIREQCKKLLCIN